MELYLATDSGRLQQAMACTAQLAHMSYRIGPDGTLLASPLPDTLRGGLLMLSDEGGTYPGRAGGPVPPAGAGMSASAVRRRSPGCHAAGGLLPDIG